MVGLGRGSSLIYHPALYLDTQLVLALTAGVIGSAPVLPLLLRLRNRGLCAVSGAAGSFLKTGAAVSELVSLSLLFLLSTMFLAASTHNPFIYFRF